MHLNDFSFTLPPEQVARYPLAQRGASRLLCVQKTFTHRHFSDVIDLVAPGDLLIFNDTKVIPARLIGRKVTGGRVEVLIERLLDDSHCLAQVHANRAPRVGDRLFFPQGVCIDIQDRKEPFYVLRYLSAPILKMIETIGHIPLPPYLQRQPNEADKERYQTVYARYNGSVAAPTAGLHFDHTLLQALRDKAVQIGYLTLHIGAGTFAPVRVERLEEHQMHAEYFTVSADLCRQIERTKKSGKRVIAIGTTSLRALESACQQGTLQANHGETTLFIYPGYTFHCADALITNLHLPSSTLLMLVCAFGGYANVMQAYQAAVAYRYRFYSYGDAMWVEKASG